MRQRLLSVLVSSIGLSIGACGSPPAPKVDAAPPPAPAQPSEVLGVAGAAATAGEAPVPATNQPQAATNAADAAQSSTPASTATEPASTEPKFYPIDVITGPEMAYLLDYPNSGAAEAAKKSCAGKAEEVPAKHAECLAKAHDRFGGDVLRFKKDSKGHVRLTMYRRNDRALMETYTSGVELKEVNPHTVKVEIKGGAGQRPIMRERSSFEIGVPNGYSIELDDSTYGKLTYEAKVGLVAN
jgi:hypothetical protein